MVNSLVGSLIVFKVVAVKASIIPLSPTNRRPIKQLLFQRHRWSISVKASPLHRSSNMANIGTTVTAFSGLTEQGESWIIDSGASDHMTRCERLFLSYVRSPGNLRVNIAEGSYTVVAGVGTVRLSSLITLQGVLHIPKLLCNLKSFSKITNDLNCVVSLTQSACVFQDRTSGTRIGNAKELSRLYYF